VSPREKAVRALARAKRHEMECHRALVKYEKAWHRAVGAVVNARERLDEATNAEVQQAARPAPSMPPVW
jgi:hypothetical protein